MTTQRFHLLLKRSKHFAKPLLGLALLILILNQLSLSELSALLRKVELKWFFLGLIFLALSNFLSACRWRSIAKGLGITITLAIASRLYAQGITANTVLPGGVLGGDLLRGHGLIRFGATKSNAALSVLLDRLSGVWALAILSLCTLLSALVLGIEGHNLDNLWLTAYFLSALGITLLPIFSVKRYRMASRIFLRQLWVSLLVQGFAVLAFWTCFRSLGESMSPLPFTATCLGVFVAAVVPAAVGGFGSRELGALVFMAPLDIGREVIFTGSLLFGLMATTQGLIALCFLLRRQGQGISAANSESTHT
jgi:uncharacterized membrane protein YbhN (UPF0104 family)